MEQKPGTTDEARTDDPGEQTPEIRLYLAMAALREGLRNHRMFRDIVDRRNRAGRVRDNFRDVANRIAMNEKNALIASGLSSEEATGQILSQLTELARDPIPSNEPDDFLDHPRRILSNVTDAAARARQAWHDGGAKVLDDALNPGTSVRSVQLNTKLGEVESVVSGLGFCIENLNSVMDGHVQTMTDLAKWFDGACAELRAVIELPALEPRTVHKADTDSLDHAKPESPMPMTAMRAGASLEWLGEVAPELIAEGRATDADRKRQWEYIREHGCKAYGEDEIPGFETWTRYVREYIKLTEGPRNTPRFGRSGRSIVSQDGSRHDGRPS